jgi:hypothetical protein
MTRSESRTSRRLPLAFPLRLPLALLATLLGAAALPAGGMAADAAAKAGGAANPQKETITGVRTVGVAMYEWYKKEQAPKRTTHPKEAASESVDLSVIPVISREELAKLLVPRYIAAIPETDGWGHPYEFRLNTQDPDAERVMAVRSAGADGVFSGTTYAIGAFPAAQADQDLVWADGYFIRWPKKK